MFGVVFAELFEVLKPGQTVNADLYCEKLARVNQFFVEKYSTIVQDHTVQDDHWKKLMNWGEVLPHPIYSHDIAPSDFHLIRPLKHFLSRKKFENFDDVQNAISRYFT